MATTRSTQNNEEVNLCDSRQQEQWEHRLGVGGGGRVWERDQRERNVERVARAAKETSVWRVYGRNFDQRREN
jgi:hypothetical protein